MQEVKFPKPNKTSMTKLFGLSSLLFFILSCNSLDSNTNSIDAKSVDVSKNQIIEKEKYELHLPSNEVNSVLILFGGFGQGAKEIKREFVILDKAIDKNIAVLYINFNKKLWLDLKDKTQLKELVEEVLKENKLSEKKVYFGGFSSGGNVSLLLADFLKSENSFIKTKGIFSVDSPLDLLELYKVSERNIEYDFSESSVNESKFIIDFFKKALGDPENGIEKYESYSPFTMETKNVKNLANLDGMKIRFYTEPALKWWKENRMNGPEDLNAHFIEKLAYQLKIELQNSNIEYITTKDKGYRANGDRHPHSWSIVDRDDLIKWILD